MLLPRAIPCLLLKGSGFVKTTKFANPSYLGDPINIIKLFNDKEVDELVILDIAATPEGRQPNLPFLLELSSEAFIPLAYGGGISDVEQMRALFASGIEKVVVNTAAVRDPQLIRRAADEFGSQSVVVSIDVRARMMGGYRVYTNGGRRKTSLDPVRFAQQMQEAGAGELIVTSIDRDGTWSGYDLSLVRAVTSAVDIPVVASGGAGELLDLRRAVVDGGASAASAGSLFVYQRKHRAVLVSFPDRAQLNELFAAVPA